MGKFVFIFSIFALFTTQSIAQNWDKVYNEKNGMQIVMKNNKYGYIDATGKIIVAAIYQDAFNFQATGYAVIKNNGKLGCINKNGDIVIPIEYDKIYNFKEGYAIVSQNSKYGYANTNGEIIIPIMYDDAFNFKNGKATVVLNNKKGKVNTAGKVTWGLAIGDYAHGGVVIKLDESGEHGVVCDIKDCGGLGKELQFTDAEFCAEGIRSKIKGKMWRLPNWDELELIHKQYKLIDKTSQANGGGPFRGKYYWSSKRDSNNRFNHYAGYVTIGGGMNSEKGDMNTKHSLRAVRDF